MPIQIAERGSEQVCASKFAELRNTQEFWNLIDRDLVTVKILASGGAVLSAGPFVGRAICGDELVEIVEKIPGSLEALVSYLANEAITIEPILGARTQIGRLMRYLVRAFLQEARRYLTLGMEFEYRREKGQGPLVLGPIRIPATLRLRARGFRHHVAFDRTIASRETVKNVAVSRALREVELIARLVELDSASIVQARALRMYFEDYRSVATNSRQGLADECEALLHFEDADADLLALCALLLRHESFETTDWIGATAPRSWFINLESLFERALLHAIDQVGYAGLSAAKGTDFKRSVFRRPAHGAANPDIVLLQDGLTVGIGDAKYKAWHDKPIRSDLYQLMVHSEAFGSSVSFLAYASDHYQSRFLGESVTGAEVHMYALDVGNLETSVTSMLENLDFAMPKSIIDNATG